MDLSLTGYGMLTFGRSLAYAYVFDGSTNEGIKDLLHYVVNNSSDDDLSLFREGFDNLACTLIAERFKDDAKGFITNNDVTFGALASLLTEGINISKSYSFDDITRKLDMYVIEHITINNLKNVSIPDINKLEAIKLLSLSLAVREYAVTIRPFYLERLSR